jgi:hypothetical protein
VSGLPAELPNRVGYLARILTEPLGPCRLQHGRDT